MRERARPPSDVTRISRDQQMRERDFWRGREGEEVATHQMLSRTVVDMEGGSYDDVNTRRTNAATLIPSSSSSLSLTNANFSSLTVLDVRASRLLRLPPLGACCHCLEVMLCDNNRLVNLDCFAGASFPRLRLVSVTRNSLVAAKGILGAAPSLRKLDAADNNITARQLSLMLGEGNETHTSLEMLLLRENNLERLVDMSRLVSLRRLDLSGNDLGADALVCASRLLPATLVSLHLRDIPLRGASELRELCVLPRLGRVDVSGCGADIYRLRALLPSQVQVIDDTASRAEYLLSHRHQRRSVRHQREQKQHQHEREALFENPSKTKTTRFEAERLQVSGRRRDRLSAVDLNVLSVSSKLGSTKPKIQSRRATTSNGHREPARGSLEWVLSVAPRHDVSSHRKGRTYSDEEEAIVRLQALARGFIARRRFEEFAASNRAATTIQAHWRGHRSRRQSVEVDLSLRVSALEAELGEERRRREALEEEHLKLEEAVRFLWSEVLVLRGGGGKSGSDGGGGKAEDDRLAHNERDDDV